MKMKRSEFHVSTLVYLENITFLKRTAEDMCSIPFTLFENISVLLFYFYICIFTQENFKNINVWE